MTFVLALCALLVTLTFAGSALAQGQQVWRLQPIQLTDVYAGQPRALRVDGMEYHARGGTVAITALNDGECQPGQGIPTTNVLQRFRFSWTFDRDVTTLVTDQPVTTTFRIEGDAQPCLDQNPLLSLQVDTDPVLTGDRGWGTIGGFHFKPIPPTHVPGPRVFRFRFASWRQTGLFIVNISGFTGRRGMQLQFTYPYQRVAEPVPPAGDPSGQDMARRAGRDQRFGGAVPGSAGALPTWSPAWELRWMDFGFAGGRVVRIYHITNRTNPAARYTIYQDPDTGQWTGWESAG